MEIKVEPEKNESGEDLKSFISAELARFKAEMEAERAREDADEKDAEIERLRRDLEEWDRELKAANEEREADKHKLEEYARALDEQDAHIEHLEETEDMSEGDEDTPVIIEAPEITENMEVEPAKKSVGFFE